MSGGTGNRCGQQQRCYMQQPLKEQVRAVAAGVSEVEPFQGAAGAGLTTVETA